MANRKDLKKAINGVCGDLFANALAAQLLSQETVSPETIDGILGEILQLQNEYIVRISHTEKGSERKFYATLRHEFETKANAIIDKIKSLN